MTGKLTNEKWLHPLLRAVWHMMEKKAESDDVKIVLTETGRTDERQAALHAIGRTDFKTSPGTIVTNMKVPGAHGLRDCKGVKYCMALDFVIVSNGSYRWTHPYYKVLGEFVESLGCFWGGRWKSLNDVYHVQLTDGLTSTQIINGERPEWWEADYIGEWNEGQICNVIAHGFMSGYSKSEFKPEKPISRGELAVVISNLIEKGVLS